MAARPRRIPSYRLHKPTGQGVVRLDGHDVYLGKHGTEASREKYHRVIAEWLTTGRHPAPSPAQPAAGVELTVSQMILAFWGHAEQHYRSPQGVPTRELDNLRDALRP